MQKLNLNADNDSQFMIFGDVRNIERDRNMLKVSQN